MEHQGPGCLTTLWTPFFLKDCPMKMDQTNVLATVYRKKGRSFVALGSWAAKETLVSLNIDWKALGLDPARTELYAPPIAGMQTERLWKPGELIPVLPKRGWFLVVDEVNRSVAPGTQSPDLIPKK
jgi:hypothetical protein